LKRDKTVAPKQFPHSKTKTGTLVIGIGNEYSRDDAVGLIVARRLKEKKPDKLKVLEGSGEGAALMESWSGADAVVLVDAVHSGAKPGTIHRLDASTQTIPNRIFHHSTHSFSISDAIELARTLNRLPRSLIVYGIEGKQFESGPGLSPEVEEAVNVVIERLLEEILL
jgi:hydrogenase maturation protease